MQQLGAQSAIASSQPSPTPLPLLSPPPPAQEELRAALEARTSELEAATAAHAGALAAKDAELGDRQAQAQALEEAKVGGAKEGQRAAGGPTIAGRFTLAAMGCH